VVFLARHGDEHTIPPHQVNYRANLWALRGVCANRHRRGGGGRQHSFRPQAGRSGDPAPDHRLHLGAPSTFHEGPDSAVTHVDFTEPYDPALRRRIGDAAAAIGAGSAIAAVYAATQGPRLETAAEINRLERDGADVVGMTGMPEAVLARELAIPYAAINVVANYAAGRGDSREASAWKPSIAVLEGAMQQVLRSSKRC
jgi:5'-methylthioinosine phosphorylase